MTETLNLRKYLCRKCDYTGWIMHDQFGKPLTYIRQEIYVTKDGDEVTTEFEYSYAKECRCLLNIRAGDYN